MNGADGREIPLRDLYVLMNMDAETSHDLVGALPETSLPIDKSLCIVPTQQEALRNSVAQPKRLTKDYTRQSQCEYYDDHILAKKDKGTKTLVGQVDGTSVYRVVPSKTKKMGFEYICQQVNVPSIQDDMDTSEIINMSSEDETIPVEIQEVAVMSMGSDFARDNTISPHHLILYNSHVKKGVLENHYELVPNGMTLTQYLETASDEQCKSAIMQVAVALYTMWVRNSVSFPNIHPDNILMSDLGSEWKHGLLKYRIQGKAYKAEVNRYIALMTDYSKFEYDRDVGVQPMKSLVECIDPKPVDISKVATWKELFDTLNADVDTKDGPIAEYFPEP